MWWNRQLSSAANTHSGNSLVPALNHLSCAETEFEWFIAIPRCIKLTTVAPRNTDVMHRDVLALGCLVTSANDDVRRDQFAWSVGLRNGDGGFRIGHDAEPPQFRKELSPLVLRGLNCFLGGGDRI